MKTILLIALFATAMCVQSGEASAQAGGTQVKPAPMATAPAAKAATVNKPAAKPTATASDPAAEIAARPDGFRYYWHNGEWWYFTAQNTWLRWNGRAWVVHHSINDAGAFEPAQTLQPQATRPSGDDSVPGTDGSYRYQINRRKGGL